MSGAATRSAAAYGYERIRLDPRMEVVPHSEELSADELLLFTDRSDKDGSLTDCLSFVVMRPVFAPFFQKRRQERKSAPPSTNGDLERHHTTVEAGRRRAGSARAPERCFGTSIVRATIRTPVPVNTRALFGSNGGSFRYKAGVFGYPRGRYARVRPLIE